MADAKCYHCRKYIAVLYKLGTWKMLMVCAVLPNKKAVCYQAAP